MPKLPKTAKKTAKPITTAKSVAKKPLAKKTVKKVAAPVDPRYPIGKCAIPAAIKPKDIRKAIEAIAELPKALREAVRGLNNKKLDTPYREGGWTVRQLVHHIADSHATAAHRFRKALTEETPAVNGYKEAAFAELADKTAPVKHSLDVLDGTHARWVLLMQSMSKKDFERAVQHAERGPMSLALMTLVYGWHSKHHVAHITTLRKQQGW